MIPHPTALWTTHRARIRPRRRALRPHRCNAPEQSQACDPMLTLSSLRAAGGRLFDIQNSRKVIMSNGGEMEKKHTPLLLGRGVTGQGGRRQWEKSASSIF